MKAWNIEEVREPALEAAAAALYSSELPYHNFEHVLATIAAAGKIVSRCHDEGIRVDGRIAYYALLFHDAGFHEDHRALGFDTKEAYSAELARRSLMQHKCPARTTKKVLAAILSTQRNARFLTAEQKVVRAADLSGLAAAYPIFRDNTQRLKKEYELIHAEALSWGDWRGQVVETVNFYLSQKIRLTSDFTNKRGESAFHLAVRTNLQRFLAEQFED